MKLGHKLDEYRATIYYFLGQKGISPDEVRHGYQAWAIATQSGVAHDAYSLGRDIYDAHVQTVLERIFPKAVFQSPKKY